MPTFSFTVGRQVLSPGAGGFQWRHCPLPNLLSENAARLPESYFTQCADTLFLLLKPSICFIIFRCFILTVKYSCTFSLCELSLPPCLSTVFDQTGTDGTKNGQCPLVLNAPHDLCRNTETKHGVGEVHVDLK